MAGATMHQQLTYSPPADTHKGCRHSVKVPSYFLHWIDPHVYKRCDSFILAWFQASSQASLRFCLQGPPKRCDNARISVDALYWVLYDSRSMPYAAEEEKLTKKRKQCCVFYDLCWRPKGFLARTFHYSRHPNTKYTHHSPDSVCSSPLLVINGCYEELLAARNHAYVPPSAWVSNDKSWSWFLFITCQITVSACASSTGNVCSCVTLNRPAIFKSAEHTGLTKSYVCTHQHA